MSSRAKLGFALFGVAVAIMLVAGGVLVWKAADAARRQRDLEREAALRAQEESERAELRAIFTSPIAPTAGDLAAFQPLFDSLARSLDRRDGEAAVGHFDLDRMFEQIASASPVAGTDLKPTPADRAEFHRIGTQTLGPALIGNSFLRWTRTTIRRIRWSADRTEALVFAVHRDDTDDGPSDLKMRWWLVSTPHGWKIYDLEDLDGGMRFSVTLALLLTPEIAADPFRFRKSAEALRIAMAAVQDGDAETAADVLEQIEWPNPPPPFAAIRALIEGRIRMLHGDFAGAMRDFDRAAVLNPDMPVIHLARTIALAKWGKYEAALAEAKRYPEALGPDPVVSFWEGYCLEALGRLDDAALAYGHALDDAPDYPEAFNGLRRVLPPDRKGELAARLDRAKKPLASFDALLAAARTDRDDAGAAALLGWLQGKYPDDVRAILSDIRDKVRTGEFNTATFRVRAALAKATGDERKDILAGYLFAMLDAGRPVDGYLGVPAADARTAFRKLAAELEEAIQLHEGDAPSPAIDLLAQLIAAHRKQNPDDPWLWYYDGFLLQITGKLDDAQQAFAAGMARLEEQPPADANERKWDREAFRSRRVSCFYDLKQGLRAYAEVGPPHDTFRQLAYRYSADGDAAGLAKLIEAHEKAFPDDPLVLYWRAEVKFLLKEYLAAADGFAKYRAIALEKDAERFAALDKQLRSLLRAGRPAEAKMVLIESKDPRIAAGLRGAVLAANETEMELEALMAAQVKQPGGLYTLYGDPDFAREIANEKFAPLREKYPDPRAKPDK